jgi:hypothetical protein
MIVKCMDGEEFAAETAADVVRQMKNVEWNAPARKRDYMLEVVERVEDQTGVFANQDLLPTSADTDEYLDPAHFLAYLAEAGVVEIVHENPVS